MGFHAPFKFYVSIILFFVFIYFCRNRMFCTGKIEITLVKEGGQKSRLKEGEE